MLALGRRLGGDGDCKIVSKLRSFATFPRTNWRGVRDSFIGEPEELNTVRVMRGIADSRLPDAMALIVCWLEFDEAFWSKSCDVSEERFGRCFVVIWYPQVCCLLP